MDKTFKVLAIVCWVTLGVGNIADGSSQQIDYQRHHQERPQIRLTTTEISINKNHEERPQILFSNPTTVPSIPLLTPSPDASRTDSHHHQERPQVLLPSDTRKAEKTSSANHQERPQILFPAIEDLVSGNENGESVKQKYRRSSQDDKQRQDPLQPQPRPQWDSRFGFLDHGCGCGCHSYHKHKHNHHHYYTEPEVDVPDRRSGVQYYVNPWNNDIIPLTKLKAVQANSLKGNEPDAHHQRQSGKLNCFYLHFFISLKFEGHHHHHHQHYQPGTTTEVYYEYYSSESDDCHHKRFEDSDGPIIFPNDKRKKTIN